MDRYNVVLLLQGSVVQTMSAIQLPVTGIKVPGLTSHKQVKDRNNLIADIPSLRTIVYTVYCMVLCTVNPVKEREGLGQYCSSHYITTNEQNKFNRVCY